MLGQSSELQQHKIQNMIFALPEPEILSYLLITKAIMTVDTVGDGDRLVQVRAHNGIINTFANGFP